MSGRRIGIVGTGIAGLTAASELTRAGHQVTVFEAGDHVGGHTDTHTIEAEGRTFEVDTGFIVFNDRNYPNFERLLAEHGVATQETQMSFGVSDSRGEFEWSARGLGGVFANRSHVRDPRFLRMLLDIARFNRKAKSLLGLRGEGPSLVDFLSENGFSDYFVNRLLIPQAASIWSAEPNRMSRFPASFLAEFFHNHGTLQFLDRPQWKTVVGGSRSYVRALTASFAERIWVRNPVQAIVREPEEVVVRLADGESRFDEVVIAAHSDQALAMIDSPTAAEREILSAIPYQPNEALLHTDERLMPQRRAAWASWNFHLIDQPARTTLTYDMNRLQRLRTRETNFLVTLNRREEIDPDKVLASRRYSHPVFTNDGMRAQERWSQISGADRIHYCGAYWRWGFHEDGCWSGLRVSEALGGRGPGLGGVVPASVGDSPGGAHELEPAR